MSIGALDRVLNFSEAEGGSRLVLIVLAEAMNLHEDDEGWETCWPSKKTIAGKARLSVRQVQRCIQELVELGELISEPHPYWEGRQDRKPNRYRLRGDKLTGRSFYGETSATERGDICDTYGETSATERGDTHDSQTISKTMKGNRNLNRSSPHLSLELQNSLSTDVSNSTDEVQLFNENQVERALTPEEWFKKAWAEMPVGKSDPAGAKRKFLARVKEGVIPEALVQATKHYAEFVKAERVNPKGGYFVMGGGRFYGGEWEMHVTPRVESQAKTETNAERLRREAREDREAREKAEQQ